STLPPPGYSYTRCGTPSHPWRVRRTVPAPPPHPASQFSGSAPPNRLAGVRMSQYESSTSRTLAPQRRTRHERQRAHPPPATTPSRSGPSDGCWPERRAVGCSGTEWEGARRRVGAAGEEDIVDGDADGGGAMDTDGEMQTQAQTGTGGQGADAPRGGRGGEGAMSTDVVDAEGRRSHGREGKRTARIGCTPAAWGVDVHVEVDVGELAP
ncbi:hypothetical protein B0H13DRAFT_2495636, partial [Mycena leptocephala]